MLTQKAFSPAAAWYFTFMAWSFFALRAKKDHIKVGLSLTALLPAAAWYFVLIVGHFFPCGAKNDPQGIESDRQAKALLWL